MLDEYLILLCLCMAFAFPTKVSLSQSRNFLVAILPLLSLWEMSEQLCGAELHAELNSQIIIIV